jgi:DNA-directed RNA polymerase subunit RPC12/RpoP
MSEPADLEIATFEARCAACGHRFDHPSFGDFGYGQLLFCAESGKFYAYFDATNAVAALVSVVLAEGVAPEVYQTVLARVADSMLGQRLTTGIRCPSCSSAELSHWGGRRTGTVWVKPATYRMLLSSPRNALIEKILNAAGDA